MQISSGAELLLKLLLKRGATGKKNNAMVYDVVSYLCNRDDVVGAISEGLPIDWSAIRRPDTISSCEDIWEQLCEVIDTVTVSTTYVDPLMFLKAVVEELHPVAVVIDDVNQALKVIVGNKIYTDKQVQECSRILANIVKRKQQETSENEFSEQIPEWQGGLSVLSDQYLDSLSEEEFTKLELEKWKSLTNVKYHPYLEDINVKGLMNMKKLFMDFFGEYFNPKGWQRWTLANLRRFNIIVSSRRGGKTYFGCYLAGRQLRLPNQTIIYVVPTLKNHAAAPWRYLETFFGNDPEVSFDRSSWTIKHKTLKSEMQFLSAERDSNARSQAANLLIFDEAAFIDEEMYETASALVRTTKGIVYVISTVNPKTPKNWFYYKLIEGEIEMYDPENTKLTRRVTLTDNPFIDDDEKEQIIIDGRRNPKMFGAEWMCEFQESETFDLKNLWVIDYDPVEKMFADLWTGYFQRNAIFKEVSTYQKFYIGYDAAKRKDMPGVVTCATKTIEVGDSSKNIVDIVQAGYLKDLEYYDQVKILVAMRNYFGGEGKCDIVVEMNNTGVVVEEILRREYRIIPIAVTAIGGLVVKRDATGWYVGKDVMVGKIKTAMSMKQLRAFAFMNELRAEFEAYDESLINQRTGGHHFDIISALRTVVWWISKTGWFLNEGDENIQEGYDMFQEAFSLPSSLFGRESEWGRFQNGGF